MCVLAIQPNDDEIIVQPKMIEEEIELKTGKFMPEWTGKLNFYLLAIDDLFRNGPYAPTIGCSL